MLMGLLLRGLTMLLLLLLLGELLMLLGRLVVLVVRRRRGLLGLLGWLRQPGLGVGLLQGLQGLLVGQGCWLLGRRRWCLQLLLGQG
jgi:hypothetical protein